MAGRGPAPKDPRSLHGHRSMAEKQVTSIPGDARSVPAPPLADAEQYDRRTRHWYNVWAGSPQANQFTATDWQRLHMLARLVDRFYLTGDRATFAEIRLNESSGRRRRTGSGCDGRSRQQRPSHRSWSGCAPNSDSRTVTTGASDE